MRSVHVTVCYGVYHCSKRNYEFNNMAEEFEWLPFKDKDEKGYKFIVDKNGLSYKKPNYSGVYVRRCSEPSVKEKIKDINHRDGHDQVKRQYLNIMLQHHSDDYHVECEILEAARINSMYYNQCSNFYEIRTILFWPFINIRFDSFLTYD